MFNPISTYRLQFHKEFTFQDFESVIPYLKKLGVSTIYASPIFESTPGSTHGYDALNPLVINLEIGSEEDLKRLSQLLAADNIGWLQDIVPNHMAFDPRNPWLNDVLEKGQQSPYSGYFDIDWNSATHTGKLMVPFLGTSLEKTIEAGELELIIHEGKLALKYYDVFYPTNHFAYGLVLKGIQDRKASKSNLQATSISDSESEYCEIFEKLKNSFEELLDDSGQKKIIEQNLQTINEDKESLTDLIHRQYYVLCHWQQTDTQINYRRFFTVNGLISLNMQDENVFENFHQFIKKLVDERIFKGLRVDHIDGLFDPTEYLERLRTLAGEETYITVEKILQPNETIPGNWNIEGNSGYDFLAIINNLFTNKKSEIQLTTFYENIASSHDVAFKDQLRKKKRLILYQHMLGDLENLYQLFLYLNLVEKSTLEVTDEDLKKAIGEFLVYCPVYRYYGNKFPLGADESNAIQEILIEIRKQHRELSPALDILSSVFFSLHEEDKEKRVQLFYQRCMQFSGPLMAKGFEDTLMYNYHRFIVHNEVGDSPASFGYTIDEFHHKMKERQKHWPLSINTTATHDTKRGEDVRARLNVLSDVPDEWLQKTEEWFSFTKQPGKENSLDDNDRYFIYQTLVGHYPMPGENDDDFKNRLGDYLQKALREAKTHSNWTSPNEEYENAAKSFAGDLLEKGKPFWKNFQSFHNAIVDFGIINSLSQVLLKFTCPGVPDVYQGTELWDLSFVDPDNRRAVDYEKREKILVELEETNHKKDFFESLWHDRYNGKIKLWLTSRLFQLRKENPLLFAEGEYIPLDVKGKWKEHIIAFARRYRDEVVIVVAPLHLAEICRQQRKEWQEIDWGNTKIVLPNNMVPTAENIFLSESLELSTDIPIKQVFQQLPFAILKGSFFANERGAGILLHISSLPSPFGIGDLGPEAKSFADFLDRSYQKYWQLLPLNPTEQGQAHSPYSSTSSRAGNVLFISADNLAEVGILNKEDLKRHYLPATDKVDFHAAEEVKKKLLDEAWEIFKKQDNDSLRSAFEIFCKKEKAWLDDFSLFTILKQQNGGKPWYEWAEGFKFRNKQSLKSLSEKFADQLLKNKWFQFIFSKQWTDLKKYCNARHIQLVGDMPFYVSYDSADVWASPEIFKLDAEGNRIGVAGVPPDAFSDDGQLWGMPVFKWDILKKRNYDWWVERLKKNLELFDLVRLDHFRAFSAYWEVPVTETTAKNGKWKKGPGAHFFNHIQKTLGRLPFIAEDLGEIDEPVYQLRDQFALPGMKVLQFAFGEDMASSIHIPHNYDKNFFVYTGTHDNNTVRGWWKNEANKEQVKKYFDEEITDEKIFPLLCRTAYSSIAAGCVLPLQDLLGLNEDARMNMPSSGENNWHWRLLPGQLTGEIEKQLKGWTEIYNRK